VAQGLLPFQYESEAGEAGLTGLAGLPLYLELWRAAGLDVAVAKRNKHAALKLMRKLLKKYAFVPERLVTDDLRSYGAAVRELGIERRHERGRWRNN